jgi:hypothetical protein
MSTRKGNVIFLEDVIKKAVSMVREILEDRELPESGKDIIAEQVGAGAIIFNDLINDRNSNIDFDVTTMSALTLDSSSPISKYFPQAKAITKIRRLINMNQILTTYQEVFLPNQSRDTLSDLVLGTKQLKEVILSSATDAKKGKWINQHGMKKATHIEANFLSIPIGAPLHKILSTIYESNRLIGLVFTFIRGDIVSFRYDKKL